MPTHHTREPNFSNFKTRSVCDFESIQTSKSNRSPGEQQRAITKNESDYRILSIETVLRFNSREFAKHTVLEHLSSTVAAGWFDLPSNTVTPWRCDCTLKIFRKAIKQTATSLSWVPASTAAIASVPPRIALAILAQYLFASSQTQFTLSQVGE